ncbi:hypothetical protein ALNOE001_06060 [Candidatus Methanobinarius endosymbioticus]|uniref:Uncharacterized protein n=1 Tax=Candidatus Methanobinarius endosymbioticus TaxID=2006182 RepID=A0A366MCL6_9EURY|nr:hypothetical protein ALNOE001_06060 [Candidatus Methanobinarius endosymbioticus]
MERVHLDYFIQALATVVTIINISFINSNNARLFNGNTLGNPGVGGAITNSGVLNIENCNFNNNIADSGGAIAFYGTNLNIVWSSFINNRTVGEKSSWRGYSSCRRHPIYR